MTRFFDSKKNALNIAVHGLSFEAVDELDWDTAMTRQDTRQDYGEDRFVTYAMRHGRLHCLVWTWRHSLARPISFRKANDRERKRYEKEIKAN